ncbi:MAG TPA: hypothetical protein VF116_01650 [Ktedonobacterales bacterium]
MAENVSIDFVMLANHVEAGNGLLYISGGGWTDHHRVIQNGRVPPSHFGIAVSICIPWTATNVPHSMVIRIEDDDASTTVVRSEAQLSVGRPAALPLGAEQHAFVAINVDTVFPKAGGYRVVAALDEDADTRTWAFRVHDVQRAVV